MNHFSVILASISAATFLAAMTGMAIAALGCWIAFHVGTRQGLGFRNRRLDGLGHRLRLGQSRWRVEASADMLEDSSPLVVMQFQQSGSRVVATGEEGDGRRRWYEGVVTGRRLVLCEVSRVQRGFHVASLLLQLQESTGCLAGTRQVLFHDGSLELQQVILAPWEDAESHEAPMNGDELAAPMIGARC